MLLQLFMIVHLNTGVVSEEFPTLVEDLTTVNIDGMYTCFILNIYGMYTG